MLDFDTITSDDANAFGYDCGVSGGRYSSNPYDKWTDTDMHDAWAAGWEQGWQVRNEITAGG